MKIETMEQLSPEWFAAHIGIPSASNFSKILSPTGKPSNQAGKYADQLAYESVTGIYEESYTSADMQRGIDLEPEARAFYEFILGTEVEQVGCIYPESEKSCLCSPDGLVKGKSRGLEIKCPRPTTHIEYLRKNKLPTAYIPQVQGSLFITGYDTWDFLSYCPGIKPLLIRVERDEAWIDKFKTALYKFNKLVQKTIKEIS